MFSGKTDELIRRLVRATIARQKVQVFKPAIDVRYAVEKVTSMQAPIMTPSLSRNAVDIHAKLAGIRQSGIDEAQFRR
jgi:thymidine kinase